MFLIINLCLFIFCFYIISGLFHRIVSDVHHPLHGFLPPKLSRVYNMRAREHDYHAVAWEKNSIHEKNFLIRIFNI